ncbi:MAG: ribonuclease T(2) [Actinomycetia bacterium]|nr:ribonuclease T(2) [Actinomycetes bacterium]
MKRGDIAVFSISAGLSAMVVAAVAFSLLVIDRSPGSTAIGPGSSTSSLLIVAWGPNLCTAAPFTPGCENGHVGQMGETFILHGLWPQPPDEQFCAVPKRVADRASALQGSDMPSVKLPEDVRTNLQSVLSDVAIMAPHEWYRHGTCSDVKPAVYFSDAATLTDQVRAVLDPVFAEARGEGMSLDTVRAQFDVRFGEGAGSRVGLTCRDVDGVGTLLFEVRLSLPPVADLRAADDTLSLGDLLAQGPPLSTECSQGRLL